MDGAGFKQAVMAYQADMLREMILCNENFNYDALEEAVKLILDVEAAGNRVHVSGIGKPHHVSNYMASLLSSTGTPSYFLDGTEAIHGSAGQVVPGDVVILLSYFGDVPELVRAMYTLKANRAKLIAITGFDSSEIARESDVHLNCHVSTEGDRLGKPPRISMLSTMHMCICLSVALQEAKELSMEQYLKWHPAGHIGQK